MTKNTKLFEECLIDLENGGTGEPRSKYKSIGTLAEAFRRRSFAIKTEEQKHKEEQQSCERRSSKLIHQNENLAQKNNVTMTMNADEDLGFNKQQVGKIKLV